MVHAVDLSLPGLGRCLRVQQAPEVVAALTQALPGWPVSIAPARGLAPAIRLRRTPTGYLQRSPQLPRGLVLPTPASAVCSLVADLGGDRLARAPDLLGLHAASVEVDGRLVLFPESHRAGKSTLAVAFAAAGFRLFGDDVLGLTADGQGFALGIAPRLRLPLPETLAPELSDYAEAHAGPADARYRFVLPRGEGLAAHGESAPLGALVLLERDDAMAAPEVLALRPGEGLQQLLTQHFAHHTAPEALMARLLPLMRRLPCLLLRYAEPLAAVRCLADALRRDTPAPGGAGPARERTALAETPPPVEPRRRWAASPGGRVYPLGDELFLIDPGGGIHRLNATGQAVWRLLREEPLCGAELGELLAAHFTAPVAPVTQDVCRWLAQLAQAGLVTAVE